MAKPLMKRMDQTDALSDQPADQFFASLHHVAVKGNFTSKANELFNNSQTGFIIK